MPLDQQPLNSTWPVLRHFDQRHLRRIAMPLGGIGTGTVSLGGRGDLRDWEIMNRPAKGFTLAHSFFALYAQTPGRPAVTRCLEGPIDGADFAAADGFPCANVGLPRFAHATFDAAYPLAQVRLSDPNVPLRVRLEAFNPLIPGDPERSGLPVAVLRFVLINPGSQPVRAAVCGSLRNFIGQDGSGGQSIRNVNRFRRNEIVQGLRLSSRGVEPQSPRCGTLALVTTARRGVTHRVSWGPYRWASELIGFWEDFSADGQLSPVAFAGENEPIGSLAVTLSVAPRREAAITFVLAWHFPNRQTWTPSAAANCCAAGAGATNPNDRIGNYYTTRYRDAWEVATRVGETRKQLESDTVRFVRALTDSDLPVALKEAALSNVSVLRSQTCFRTEAGHLFGWEGCLEQQGCCAGSCTHVWNYEQTVPFLFASLSQSMREVEFAHATNADGRMSFRVHLPLSRAQECGDAAADGQMGCLVKLYRDWKLSGDDTQLRRLWPKARKALEFCWIAGGWDADRDGVMEGCQHNTYDVQFYGPNPLMAGWYLAALQAAAEMAQYLGQRDFAAVCRELCQRGSAWVDAHLFNGEYYRQAVRPALPGGRATGRGLAAPPLRQAGRQPDFQMGDGCLIDQLVGQLAAHVAGLGGLLQAKHRQQTLRSILRYNRRTSFREHFNFMRGYALQDESGVLMCSFPKGNRPTRPFPYASEAMTGCEHALAALLLYEGFPRAAVQIVTAVRARHDGYKRNPFDEIECGHHYVRSMSAWASLLAATGFHYDGVAGALAFAGADKPATWFWSNGTAWGTVSQDRHAVTLRVLYGELTLARLTITGRGVAELGRPRILKAPVVKIFGPAWW